MTIIRARFIRRSGLHLAGEWYLIELAELEQALVEGCIALDSVEIVEPQNPPARTEDIARVAELLAPPHQVDIEEIATADGVQP